MAAVGDGYAVNGGDLGLVALLLEPALRVEGGHRPGAGGRDGLAVRVILDVAGGEDARDVRPRRARLRHEVALVVVVEPVEEERRGRVVTDGDEQPVGLDLACLAGHGVAQPEPGDVPVALAEHLVDDRVQDELDLLVLRGAVDHDRRRAELVAPVDDHDLAREAGEERRLLHRGVAAAHDRDDLVAEERAVAGRAVRDAASLQRLLRREPELTCARTGRDDDRVRAVLVVADVHPERPLGEVDARDVVGHELRAEALGLAAEVGHHRRPDDAVGVARVVLDVARDHQLAAPVEALDDERGQVGARGVEGCRVARPGRHR